MAGPQTPRRLLLLLTGVHANGGIQRFNQTLISALGEYHVSCDVLSIHDTADGKRDDMGVRIRGFQGSRLRFSKAAIRAILFGRYDWLVIGHINLLLLASITMLCRPFARARTVLIAHGIEVWKDLGRARQWGIRRVATTLCVSRYTRQRIIDQVPGIDATRVRVYPNCISRTWSGLADDDRPSEIHGPYLLSVTRLERGDRYKGIATVIEALSQLEDASLQYVVVGHGNDLQFLQQVAVRFGVAHRVRFLRGISDAQLTRLYANCHAFVLPSGKEGFGIVFLEAMYFGAPVIAAAEKGALDVIQDGETGLLVRYGDSISLRMAIERLGTDQELRSRLCERGRSSVHGDGEFTFSKFVQRTADVFALRELPAA